MHNEYLLKSDNRSKQSEDTYKKARPSSRFQSFPTDNFSNSSARFFIAHKKKKNSEEPNITLTS